MIHISDKERCCGCGACAQICPSNCITMVSDAEGFLYPSVNADSCVHCGLCERACPIINADESTQNDDASLFDEPHAIGGWNRDAAVRQASSSGGAFTAFATEIIRQGGVVYGAVMRGRTVVHTAATSEAELSAMRGSKYVQSDIGDSYKQVKRHLGEGRPVLFTGTPCQTAGLLSYLGGRRDNLYLVDFICHGVPSPGVFSRYLDSVEASSGSRIVAFSFREKDKGWHPSGLQLGTRIQLENGSVIRKYPALRDTYMNGFLEDIYLRPSCYNCRFKCIPKHSADITIADFWGIQKVMPEMNDGKGTSLMLIHNARGMELFDRVRDCFEYRECDWREATKKNQTLLLSANKTPKRALFFQDLERYGYEKTAARYMTTGRTVFNKIRRILGNKFEKTLMAVVRRLAGVFGKQISEEAQGSVLQFLKFCAVGVSNVAVSYSVNVLTLLLLRLVKPGLKVDYIIANTVAFLVAVYWSFLWNSKKVFHFDAADKASRRKALLKTYVCYGFTGIILNNVLSTIWINVLGISKLISPLINLFFTIPINYLTNKKWAFADPNRSR